MNKTVVYDAGMIIGLANRKKQVQGQHSMICRFERPIIPGPVLAQVWRDQPATKYLLSRYLHDCVVYTDYSKQDYKRVGIMLGDATLPNKKRPDVVDALVVLTAAIYGAAVIVTSDPDDIKAYTASVPRAEIDIISI